MKKILFTGGLGYIGSHTAVEVINSGFEPIIVDDLSNSKISVLDKIEKITGVKPKFYQINCCDKERLETVFKEIDDIFAVIHFAGFKAVGESVKLPLMYYRNNLDSTLSILELCEKYNVKNFIFSSSATVYENTGKLPLDEECPLSATNPYGRTKLYIENILKDYNHANPDFNVVALRYFNPIGAHESGLLGEDPNGIPNNLMPYICKVAVGELDHLNVFGNDYETKDGTGVRDYIHVVDLAVGHVKALEKMVKENVGFEVYNLGVGVGYSVLDIVNTFNKVNGNLVRYEIAPRRAGDIAECYASAKKAKDELGFVATKTLEDMCKSSYQFQKNNK